MGRILAALVFGLAGCAVLVSLGLWQVERMGWKRAILDDLAQRIAADPVPLPDQPDPARDNYLAVHLAGQAETQEVHVLTSLKPAGPGFRVLTPFVTDTGRRVIVDWGYVPESHKQASPRVLAGTLTGNLNWPDDITRSTPAPNLERNIWFGRDVAALAEHLGTEPVLIVARDTGPGAGPVPMPVGLNVPDDHLNYAITWFSLALIWAGMTVYLLWRIRRRTV